MLKANTRAELAIELKKLREAGYRYMTRDEHSAFIRIFGIRPRKAKNGHAIWTYENSNAPGTIAIKKIHCEAATEIKWENQKPTDIAEWLKVYDRC